MDARKKALEAIGRAEQSGMRVEYDSAITVVHRRPTKDGDVLEVEDKILRQLAAHLREVEQIVRGRARAARGKELAGHQAFAVDHQILGTIERCAGDGLVVRYLANEGEESERQAAHFCDADRSLIIRTGGGHSAAPSDFPASVSEETREFLKRAEKQGVRFEWDCFLFARFPAERRVTARTIQNLDPPPPARSGLDSWVLRESPWIGRLNEISRLTLDRARAARANDFVGEIIFSPTIEAIEPGFDAKGMVTGSSSGGSEFSVATRNHWGPITVSCNARDLLVVLDEAEPSVPSLTAAAGPEKQGFVKRVRNALGNAG